MSRITSYFHIATPDEVAEQTTRASESIRQFRAWNVAEKEVAKQEQAQHEKALNRARQQKFRLNQRMAEVKLGQRDPQTHRKIKAMKLGNTLPVTSSAEPAQPDNCDEIIEPPQKKRRAARTNWAEPTLWAIITSAAKRAGFSGPQSIVNELQRGPNGSLFKNLDWGTVGSWINKTRTGWTQAALDRAARMARAITRKEAPRVPCSGEKLGRPHTLDQFPDLKGKIVQQLTTIRLAKVPVTRGVARATVIAYVKSFAPVLLDDSTFKCSEAWIRRLLKGELDWSYRTTTQAAQKLPDNWLEQCTNMSMRATWHICLHEIPAELVINTDQTGVCYLGTGDKTWEVKGSKQVVGHGKGDKRQFTIMVGVTQGGTMLPWQGIFKGGTAASLPSPAARKECESKGFCFTPGGDKHWSNFICMKKWVSDVAVPHIDTYCRNAGLPANQKALLILDCWSVHRGDEFLTYMRTNHPRIIILFIPGGCTGVAQPCDLNINRTLKHLLRTSCVQHLADKTVKQLDRGCKPTEVRMDTTPAALRNACTDWLLSAWRWFVAHPESVLKAWSMAKFGDINMSYEVLTNRTRRSIVRKRFSDDPGFRLSVSHEPVNTNGSKLEEDQDGIDYDDDTALDPDILYDICALNRTARPALPDNVFDFDGSFVYSGDEDF